MPTIPSYIHMHGEDDDFISCVDPPSVCFVRTGIVISIFNVHGLPGVAVKVSSSDLFNPNLPWKTSEIHAIPGGKMTWNPNNEHKIQYTGYTAHIAADNYRVLVHAPDNGIAITVSWVGEDGDLKSSGIIVFPEIVANDDLGDDDEVQKLVSSLLQVEKWLLGQVMDTGGWTHVVVINDSTSYRCRGVCLY